MTASTTSTFGDDDLIAAIRARASNRATQADREDREGTPGLSSPASEAACAAAERELGTKLHPFHRRLLTEVANGDFGPSLGLFGLPPDSGRPSMLELREALRATDKHAAWPNVVSLPEEIWQGLLPIIDWGCAQWSIIDSSSAAGDVLTLTEDGLFETSYEIRTLFHAWVDGVDVFDNLFAPFFETHPTMLTDPFTREPILMPGSRRLTGIPFTGRRRTL